MPLAQGKQKEPRKTQNAFTPTATDKEIIQRQLSTPRLHKLIAEKFIHNKILGLSRQACHILSLGNLTTAELITVQLCDWQWCTAKTTMGRTQTPGRAPSAHWRTTPVYNTDFCLFWGALFQNQTDPLSHYQGPQHHQLYFCYNRRTASASGVR